MAKDEGKRKDAGVVDNSNDGVADMDLPTSEIGGVFRGIAAAARAKLPILKAVSAKAVRSIGSNRPLAFASEGAVAGNALMPRWLYYGAWGMSGVAIGADITRKTWDAPVEQKWETAAYWTTFHVPASLVIPAVIIHKIVHATEHSMEHHSYAKRIPPRLKATLGQYLGLKFDHHHHDDDEKSPPIESAKGKEKED
jgi:hypothetical protein